jgi:hypothetical protein
MTINKIGKEKQIEILAARKSFLLAQIERLEPIKIQAEIASLDKQIADAKAIPDTKVTHE